MTALDDIAADILGGAKFYARASSVRAVYGRIPNPDPDADDAYWKRISPATRKHSIAMVRLILQSADYSRREAAAGERAIADLDRAEAALAQSPKERR